MNASEDLVQNILQKLNEQPPVPFKYYSPAFEQIPQKESDHIKDLVELTLKFLQMRYGDGVGKRGVHPKAHGCVKATFTVNQDIPDALRVGVFKTPGKVYDAWIRFSNATALIQPDMDPQTGASSRGFALKLLDVEGDMLIDEDGPKAQDFLMINQPMFAFSDVEEYLQMTRIQLRDKDNISAFLKLPGVFEKKAPILKRIASSMLGNPLEAQYFSASPYLLGRNKAVKFSVKPRNPGNTPPQPLDPDFLRKALQQSMIAPDARFTFDFMIQQRVGDLPIEDASAEWPESVAPFQNAATIDIIGGQNVDDPQRVAECEHLVFTPWHGLVEHQPLGGINRLRLGVYKASSIYRLKSEPNSKTARCEDE